MTEPATTVRAVRLDAYDADTIDEAAEACGLTTGAWLRVVVLAAAGVSPMAVQLRAVQKKSRKGRGK